MRRLMWTAAVVPLVGCGGENPVGSGDPDLGPNPVASVSVSPRSATLNSVGAQIQLTASALDVGGASLPTATFTWSSDDPSTATVSATGLVTAVASGNTSVAARAGGITSGPAAITVLAPPTGPAGELAVTRSTVGTTDGAFVIIDADGAVVAEIAELPFMATSTRREGIWSYDWSRDGSSLVIGTWLDSLGTGNDRPLISLIELDGTVIRRLNDGTNPSWAPDGGKIAFDMHASPGHAIFSMDTLGGGVSQLTASGSVAYSPAWSPDGTRIAFHYTTGVPDEFGIYVMNADGSAPQLLTDHSTRDEAPAWSPDGSRIAFVRWTDPAQPDIWTVNADGTGLSPLVDSDEWDMDPHWSPDGQFVAFTSRRDLVEPAAHGRYPHIWMVRSDGSEEFQVTSGLVIYGGPRWRPQ